MIVQDKKTGQWYDPEVEFQKLMRKQWFLDVMKRLKAR